MIKVCSPQLGLSPISQLGGEVHDYNLIKELCKQNVKVDVLLPKNRPYERDKNLNVRFLPIKSIIPAHLFNIFIAAYLLSAYKKGVDIFRFHNPYFLGIAGKILKKIHPEVKIVTTIHLVEERWDLNLIFVYTKDIYDHFFVVSEYLKSWLVKKYNISPKKITVIFNGIDKNIKVRKKNQNLLKKYNFGNKLVLLNLGQISERKNVLFLIELFSLLNKIHSNLVLVYCGSGPLKKRLIDKINQQGLSDKVFLLNPVSGKEKNEIFNLADIFLFPSKNEGFGLVVAEAMACAKPVIASNNSSLPEEIDDGVTGFLAKTDDLDDWRKKVSLLINDNEKRKSFG